MIQEEMKQRHLLESRLNHLVGFNLFKWLNYVSILIVISFFIQCVIYWDNPSIKKVLIYIQMPSILLIIIHLLDEVIFRRKH